MESLIDIFRSHMTKCITFTVMLIINVYLTEIPHMYALRTYFFKQPGGLVSGIKEDCL